MSTRTHEEKTSADKKVVGFEYQYWFFLWRVLQLKKGETVGLEVKDDVHTDLDATYQILFQLKHTLQTNSDGQPIRLTKYDSDLWKTLSNWTKVISDPVAARGGTKEQLEFVNKTDFVLVSNKADLNDATIVNLLESTANHKAILAELEQGTQSEETKGYIKDVAKLNVKVLVAFISNVKFMGSADDLIERCKLEIEGKHIPHNRVNQLFRDIDSQIRQDNFIAIKSGQQVSVSYAGFSEKYRAFFDQARSSRLTMRNDYDPLPDDLTQQVFIRQLLEIGDVEASNIDRIVALSTHKKRTEKNLNSWEMAGEITQIDLANLELDTITSWENSFHEAHRDPDVEVLKRSRCVAEAIRKVSLVLKGDALGIAFSNGQFYRLADVPKIGFHPDWESQFGRAAS